MNHKITQIFVVGGSAATVDTSAEAFPGTGTSDTLVARQLNFYKSDFSVLARTANSATIGNEIFAAVGTGSTKYGSFKSSVIKKNNLTKVTRTTYANTTKQQITFIGYDEITTSKTPVFGCDEEYFVTFKIDEYWSKGIYQPLIQESVRVKTVSCTECGGGCDALNCYDYINEMVAKVNAHPLLSKYVTATHVFKGSAPTYKYTLTVPDSFGTGAAATYITSTLQPYYPAGTYGTITLTADADGADDANTTGNTMFEIATPLIANVADMPSFNGVIWEKQLVSAGSVTTCGIKLEGKALDAFGNACVPDAVPYVFNLVKFQANVHKGPFSTQDFDINDVVTPWYITTTQNIRYAIGQGSAMAELERHFFRNNLPNVAESVYYWNPIYNEDVNQFLYVNSSLLYNVLSIKFLDDSPVGFEKKSTNSHEILVMVDTANETSNGVIGTANVLAFFNYFAA
jgi:hypothetical protein